jgi:hypothetical protein
MKSTPRPVESGVTAYLAVDERMATLPDTEAAKASKSL